MSARNRTFWRGLLATILVLGAPAGIPHAQTSGTAELRGRVMDETGGAMPAVLVTLTNPTVALGVRSETTDSEGHYSFRILPPGRDYSLKATIPQYATVVAGPLELHAGRTTEMNLTLKPSSELEEIVKVEATGELADLSRPAASTTYNTEFVEGVPLVGRRFSDLLTLAPGVSDTDGDGHINVRGARDTGLQLRLDGTNATDPLTGHFGQGVNLESIEEVVVITGGAAAEYGRADGGFANVITKSGGNDFEGSLKVFYRTDFLDGDGANAERQETPEFSDTDAYLTAGGAMVRDHLWYFATVERLDREEPVIFTDGSAALTTKDGWRAFGKVTWQSGIDHKLALQVNYDPLRLGGNNIGELVSPETDYYLRTGGALPQLTWTAILSPTLLLQVVASHLNGRLELDPVSPNFRTIEVETFADARGQTTFALPCVSRNCQQETTLRIFAIPESSSGLGRRSASDPNESGPYSSKANLGVERWTLKSDLSYSIEDRLGQHAIKGGYEYNVESYSGEVVNNPIVTDRTCDFNNCGPAGALPPLDPSSRQGMITLEVFTPVVARYSAEAFNVGAYLQDSWKPIPGMAVNFGVRLDQESIETEGLSDFDPGAEGRKVLKIFDLWCDAVGNLCTNGRAPGRPAGPMPSRFTPPPGHPALKYDLNGDGDLETFGPEGAQVLAPYTTRAERLAENYLIKNNNMSPRFSLSWDPWDDGKTRLFASWGRYYDRLFLGTVATEQDPQSLTATWNARFGREQADPGSHSATTPGAYTVPLTDRDLATPYTNEWTIGAEREFAPEWTVSLSHVRRRGKDLLQDLDVNHITCKGFDSALDTDPMAVCGDSGGILELDRFGRIAYNPLTGQGVKMPNGAIDLYTLNPNFNQVLRVGNYNSSTYTATELTLRRRLHRNWQMMFSYTYAKALGDSESFISQQGNDPAAVSDKAEGYLDFDQRHVVKWQAVTHLPHEILLGGTLQWSSGLPYSLVGNTADIDETGNLTSQRIYSITGLKNDQRNSPQITLNARVEKRLILGRTHISAFLDAENLLDSDDLVYRQIDQNDVGIADDSRRFGRRWQIGASVFF
ncbi:MAG TPA: carboxypeptidase regulatory-like domain-containing protein [Candidatus Polarisedimenticolia bacterium]